jgi:N utilization substance protein B
MPTSRRRKARELAMQALFYMDQSPMAPKQALQLFVQQYPPPKQVDRFFNEIVSGILENRRNIDGLIEKNAQHWKLSRMSGVDRNVMRIAVFEFLFKPDIPKTVSINEAIEIGKRFGSEETGAFVNGILDSIRIELDNDAEAVPGKR